MPALLDDISRQITQATELWQALRLAGPAPYLSNTVDTSRQGMIVLPPNHEQPMLFDRHPCLRTPATHVPSPYDRSGGGESGRCKWGGAQLAFGVPLQIPG